MAKYVVQHIIIMAILAFYLHLCIMKVNNLLNMKYNKQSFNAQFKLSIDGKYKGFDRLFELLSVRHVEHLLLKLYNYVSNGVGHYHRSISDRIVIKLSGHRFVFYPI